MKKLILVLGLLVLAVAAYAAIRHKRENAFMEIEQTFQQLEAREDLKQATFSGGCFWCMEGPFEAMDGVEEVIAGYSGGSEENPTYIQVVGGTTGHRESVRIYYDPNQISYQELLKIYWYQVDPTDSGGQFADRGEQYTTAIFYHDEAQKQAAEQAINTLNESGEYEKEIVTKVLPIKNFYPAEDFHQDFYKHSKERYQIYNEGSGRKGYTQEIKESLNKVFSGQ
jgi:methionine-S-sulfoxide reductase